MGGLYYVSPPAFRVINDVYVLVLSCYIIKNLANVLDVETAIDVLANHDNGSQTASAHAAQAVKRELAIRSGLTHLNVEDALDLLKQALGTAHVASGTQAHRNRVFALGGHGEERVERHHAINLGCGHAQLAGDNALHLLGEIAVQSLALMQDVNQFTGLIAVLVADFFNLLNNGTRQFDFFFLLHIVIDVLCRLMNALIKIVRVKQVM